MATVTEPRTSGSVVLEDVSWEEYEAQLRVIGDRHVRVNYDSGRMELISPLKRHASGSYLLGMMVDTLVDELDIPCFPADPVTLKRPDLAKGVEPDKLYFLGENAARVAGERELDLTVDPPPDLIIERDATSSSVPRFPIFAALGIPGVWRLDDDLQFLRLQADRTYRPIDRSLAFPALPLADAARFLEQGQHTVNITAWIRTFRAFVRDVLVPRQAEGGR